MRIIISLALIIGFFLLLLVGLLSVLQDLFARSAHPQPAIPQPASGCRPRDEVISDGQSLSRV